jgi:hypothetical protein
LPEAASPSARAAICASIDDLIDILVASQCVVPCDA